jgi:hypothetical protein
VPLLIIPILWLLAAAGARINVLLRCVPSSALPIERRLFGLGTGLLLFSYSILLVGLLGELTLGSIIIVLALLGLIGWNEHFALAKDLAAGVSSLKFSPVNAVFAFFFLVFAVTSLVGCMTPPTASLEYDSLCYHLADPKIYLAHHRIIYLPWESHSNFAFTMEMLYAAGLAFHSVVLAKLFHFTMGVICVIATFLIGRRIHSVTAGLLGSLLLASLPVFFWEAGTAYVDLGAVAFGALSLLALTAFLMDKESEPAWMNVSMLMMAGMVSVKATSLITAALFALSVLLVRYLTTKNLPKSFAAAAAYAVVSVAIGSVWYVKSWIVTGNPFFPFAYTIFGGKHWSLSNSVVYASSQAQFGAGHKLIDLVMAPWSLVIYLNYFISGKYHPFNDYSTFWIALSPVLLAALFIPAFWNRKTSNAVRALAIYGLVSLVVWFLLTQQVRYLLPVMPAYCLLAAIVLAELLETRLMARWALSALYAVSLVFSCWIACFCLMRLELPVVLGEVDRSSFISAGLPAYGAMQFLNQDTPKNAGVAFYGEPTDFYCDRPYMWAEPGHGIVIPYDKMSSPQDLRAWFVEHGFHYIFIDYNQAHITDGPGMNGLVYGLTFGSGNQPVYQHNAIFVFNLR